MTKSLIKGTVLVLLLIPFLQISAAHIMNFVIFLVLVYGFLGGYIVNKRAAGYSLVDEGIRIRSLLGKESLIPYDNIKGLAFSQGFLARRFHCGTVYVELKKGKGSHRSPEGYGVVTMRDVRDPIGICDTLEDRMGPFAQGA